MFVGVRFNGAYWDYRDIPLPCTGCRFHCHATKNGKSTIEESNDCVSFEIGLRHRQIEDCILIFVLAEIGKSVRATPGERIHDQETENNARNDQQPRQYPGGSEYVKIESTANCENRSDNITNRLLSCSVVAPQGTNILGLCDREPCVDRRVQIF